MKAGFAEADITPSVPCAIGGYGDNFADEILSRLYARALYVEDGAASWALAACDLIGLDRREICLPVIESLRGAGFDGGVLLTASHTHSGPHTRFNTESQARRRDGRYVEMLKAVLRDIILEAHASAVPAHMGAARAFAGENINRRVNLQDGSHHYLPHEKHLYQYATGVTDEELGVVGFFRANDGAPLVTLLNYTAHALVIGNYRWVVTADYPGVLVDEFRRLSGAPALFTQGACGNIHPYGFETGPQRMREMGVTLAGKAHMAWRGIAPRENAAVAWAVRPTPLPVEKRMYEKGGDYAAHLRGLDRIETDMTAARAGDAALVGVPGELFVEVGLAIKRASPYPFTYVIYNTNSYASYIPTAEAYEEGGYEPNATLVAPGGAEVVESAAAALLGELTRA